MTIKQFIEQQLPVLKQGYIYDITQEDNKFEIYIRYNPKQILLFYKKVKGEFNETVYKYETNYFVIRISDDLDDIKEQLLNYKYKLSIEKRAVKPFNFFKGAQND